MVFLQSPLTYFLFFKKKKIKKVSSPPEWKTRLHDVCPPYQVNFVITAKGTVKERGARKYGKLVTEIIKKNEAFRSRLLFFFFTAVVEGVCVA